MTILGIRVKPTKMPGCTNCGCGSGFEYRQCQRYRRLKARYRHSKAGRTKSRLSSRPYRLRQWRLRHLKEVLPGLRPERLMPSVPTSITTDHYLFEGKVLEVYSQFRVRTLRSG
jgi:hypothetical protein